MKKLIHNYKKIKCSWLLVALLAGCLIAWASAASAETSVYAEGAYDDTSLAVYVYADIDDDAPLVSQCVNVTFNTDDLTVTSAEKNEDVWYFGDNTQKYHYKDPQDFGYDSGVVILGGKLDTSDPDAGVSGERVLLGKITFERIPETGLDFQVALQVGKPHPFANFVQTDGTVQENEGTVTIGAVEIHERGDADGDGYITNSDFFAIKPLINNKYVVYADCDGDGFITNSDYFCVKGKINQ